MGLAAQSFGEVVSECVRSSDSSAWETLVGRLLPWVAFTASRCTSSSRSVSRETIEDLMQDCLLKLCRDNFSILREVLDKPDRTIEAFVKVTVANLIRDRFRKERSPTQRPGGGLISADTMLEQVPDMRHAKVVERNLLIREIDEILKRKLTGPNASRDRKVFWLYHRHELTAKAIAAIPTFGLTEKGVESAILRLRILVKQELMEPKGIAAEGTSI
jgi:RNA polymerase sigma factor (sigma-70 family)